jgi:Flp pilus assembly protein TadG
MNSLAHRTRSFMEFCKQRLLGLAGDQLGVSAVEFALVLPLMLTLYFGVVEVSQGIAAQRKATITARTVADLVSQASSVVDSYKNNTMDAAAAVMAPFPDSNLKVTVSSIAIDANGKATVAWSDANKNGTARATGSTVTLLPALAIPNTSLIWSEVEYAYTPTIGYIMSGTLTLKDSLYMRPRLSSCVTRPPVQSACPS